MAELWLPYARRSLTFAGVGNFINVPKRGVLHTTEGGTLAGALSTYKTTGAYPHFTYDFVDNVWEQHAPISVAVTTLANVPGGVETNRHGAIQIEIVGTCDPSKKGRMPYVPEMPDKALAGLAAGMIWIEKQTGIKPQAPTFKAYPSSYGAGNGVRFSYDGWANFNGWCGHEHVPENLHGDPGNINIKALLNRGNMAGDIISAPLAGNGIFAHPGGGYYIVAVDGGVFGFNAPFYGSMGGQALAKPIQGFALTPSGKGYWLVGGDGGVFAFGDAKYQGRVVVP